MKKLILLAIATTFTAATFAQSSVKDAPVKMAPASTPTKVMPASDAAPVKPAATAVSAAPSTTQDVTPPANPNAPDIKFETETHDFGTVPEGPQAKFDFDFTNVGKEPLILQNVQASCGCTTPEWPKEPILPGGKNKVTAIYNTQGRPGPFTKTITITSNGKTPSKQIIIKGTVQAAPATTAPEKTPNIMNEPVKK